MKKGLFLIITIMLVAVVVIAVKFKLFEANKRDIAKFNSDYEEYNKENLNGLDITTIMNKAISNNEKYEIEKNENELYILDNEYSIEIYITLAIDKITYRMETINKANMSDFVRYFADVKFKCTDVKYHEKSGRIASMTFEANNY